MQRVIGFSSSTSTGELCSSFTGQCTEGATMRRRDSLRQITACPHSQVDTVSRVLGESLLPCEPVPSLGKQNPPELPCLAAKLGSSAFHPNIAPRVGLLTKARLLMYHVIVFFLVSPPSSFFYFARLCGGGQCCCIRAIAPKNLYKPNFLFVT